VPEPRVILFTTAVQLILSPFQVVQLRDMRPMQRLQPHVEELKKKHGKERRRLTEETLKLYRQHRTKPVLGLIPLIVQIPVLIGLLWVLVSLGVTPSNAVLQSQALFHSWLFHSYHHGEMVYNLFHARFLWLTNGVGKRDRSISCRLLPGQPSGFSRA
jgi:YidC/Oxa1 family membrane protein insertase